jgi:hypothetical protein
MSEVRSRSCCSAPFGGGISIHFRCWRGLLGCIAGRVLLKVPFSFHVNSVEEIEDIPSLQSNQNCCGKRRGALLTRGSGVVPIATRLPILCKDRPVIVLFHRKTAPVLTSRLWIRINDIFGRSGYMYT